ncbi:hypothetical protein [Brevundimonas diminuta]|uniref:hypothetical protein n=1 Tax=Brevundimonas diminuta TaxID=293 RepID=UPI003F801D75
MGRFQDFVDAQAPAATRPMHLTHCTSGGGCIEIMAELVLKPDHCRVYDADLLYLFYGRPAFKPCSGLGSSTLTETAPVCLVLDPQVIRDAVRILPFDSGGFERYRPHLGPGLSLPQFELAPSVDTPLRLIGAFFETTRNYYTQSPRPGHVPLISEREASGYGRLIGDGSIADDDDRRGTIEVQVPAPVSLLEALRALIAPAALLDDPAIKDALARCPDAVPLDYRTYGRASPEALSYPLYEHLERFLEKAEVFG